MSEIGGVEFHRPTFGDAATEKQWHFDRQRFALNATARFTVAPECSVKTAERRYRPGEAIPVSATSPLAVTLGRLAELGVVIETKPERLEQLRINQDPTLAYKVVIRERGVLQTPTGRALHHGDRVKASDFASERDADGEHALADYVRRGLIDRVQC